MNKLKEFISKLNSVVFMGIGSFLAIIAVLLMFAPGIQGLSEIVSSADVFFGQVGSVCFENGAWPVFVGYMLILLGALIMGIIALPIVKISSKLEKAFLFTAIASLFVGAILVMCIVPIVTGLAPANNPSWYANKPAPFVAGAFALLAAICGGIAVKYDW